MTPKKKKKKKRKKKRGNDTLPILYSRISILTVQGNTPEAEETKAVRPYTSRRSRQWRSVAFTWQRLAALGAAVFCSAGTSIPWLRLRLRRQRQRRLRLRLRHRPSSSPSPSCMAALSTRAWGAPGSWSLPWSTSLSLYVSRCYPGLAHDERKLTWLYRHGEW